MVELTSLWLPIVLSAVAVWIASAMAWMFMPHHKNDMKRLPDEDAVLNAVRGLSLSPGIYGFPDCRDHSRTKDPAFVAKMKQGPMGVLHIWPPNAMEKMGKNMFLSFVVYLVIGVFVAYLGSLSLHAGTPYLKVFQVTGTAAIMAYCFAGIPNAIWFQKPLRNLMMELLDGVVYGLLTAGFFGWLWPHADKIIGM